MWRGIRMMNQQNLNEGLMSYTLEGAEEISQIIYLSEGESENA